MKKPKDKNQYYNILVEETLQDLGRDVHHFRHLKSTIEQSELGKEINPDILFLLDGIYQSVLDSIIDGLANAADLRMAKVAINGLEKSVLVRRGLRKLNEVL